MVPLKHSIATRLLKVVFSVYLIVTVTVTLIHMVTEYLHTRQQVIEELHVYQEVFYPSLSRALWEMNYQQVRSALQGLERLPGVIGFKVEDNKARNIAMEGKVILDDTTCLLVTADGSNNQATDCSGLFGHKFIITYERGDKAFEVGKVEIFSSEAFVFSKVALGFAFLIVNAIVKTLALLLIFLFVFKRILLKPLSELTEATRNIDLENLEEVAVTVKTRANNELKVLEQAFNDMLDKLLRARRRLHQYQLSEREKLEQLVRERTVELARSEEKYRQSEAELAALFASMTDVILVLDGNGKYLKIAPTSPRLLYKPGDELLGRTLHDVLPENEADIFLKVIRDCLADGTTQTIEYSLQIEDEEIWFDGRIAPITEDTAIWVARDITEQKHWILELEEAKHRSEAANRAKSEFLANMSHELRTPLNAILGFSELMLRDPTVSKEQRTNLMTIGRSGEHLLTLINDVLEFSRIEAGKAQLSTDVFDLHLTLSGLVEMFELRAQQKGLELRFQQAENLPRYVLGDRSKVNQILINLLANAVKFTEVGHISLGVHISPQTSMGSEALLVQFSVADTGVGIAEAEQEHIFEAFFQAHNPQLPHQGTGLGLPISRKFVSLLGGTLKVSSTLGKGSRFSFVIPLQPAAKIPANHHETIPANVALAPDQSVPRLLVVEDNPDSRRLLVSLLISLGCDVLEAENGKRAIELWQQFGPQLIWMDMRMPVVDGYEATARIKSMMAEDPATVPTKIIGLTASAFESDRRKLLAHGGDDFVRKPFRESDIVAVLEKHLNLHFIYQHSAGRAAPEELPTLQEADLINRIDNLPQQLAHNLLDAVELSDIEQIKTFLQEIDTIDHSLGRALETLANDFSYDTLLRLLRHRHQPEQSDKREQ